MDLLSKLTACIDRQEGPTSNNNPGNIWDGLAEGKTKRIWPHIPLDRRGMLIFPTPEAGMAALKHDLRIKIDRGMTLRAAITMYCPPTDPRNDTEAYIRNVSHWLGISSDVADHTPLKELEQLERDGEIKFAA